MDAARSAANDHLGITTEIVSPSAEEAFDQSALQWVLHATFLPAETDGKAIESVMRMGVRFQMTE